MIKAKSVTKTMTLLVKQVSVWWVISKLGPSRDSGRFHRLILLRVKFKVVVVAEDHLRIGRTQGLLRLFYFTVPLAVIELGTDDGSA